MRYPIAISLLLIAPTLASAWVPDSNVTRGIYVHYRDLIPKTAWDEYGGGYDIVEDNPHSGDHCIRAANEPGGTGQGAGQTVQLHQDAAEPIKIAGWSRADAVAAGQPGWQYSIYVDLTYADGERWFMQIAPFKPGTHDWQYSETVIEPEKPVASARYWAFIRNVGGTVWFDDLFFGPAGGDNLLEDPGFEQNTAPDTTLRDEIFTTYRKLHANAIHTYLSLPEDEDDARNLRGVLAAAKKSGIGVVVTTHIGALPMEDADDPDFPQYNCVLGDWSDRWTQTLAGFAQYDLMGLSLVPDEYNWNTRRFKRGLTDHTDPEVAEFYKNLPNYCDCPVCHETFRQWYGQQMPEMGGWSRPPKQTDAYRKWIDFRYRATTDWIRRSAEAVKTVNPEIRADSLLCVSPICSDFRLGTGVAWDMVGYHTDIDFPTTDPYIILHNYLGDSTHWYVTETTAHLVGSTPKRQAGVVLESSRLRPQYRHLDPVEIYGSALSAVSRGAKELAWWHYVHITGQSEASQGETSFNCAGGAYDLLHRIDPWLTGARPVRRVAFLYSRASDEYFSFYTRPEPNELLTHDTEDERYPFLAQKEVLSYLFRRGIPTDLYYLDQVTENQLADYPTIIVPFPFAVGPKQAEICENLAESGKKLLIISELGKIDDLGKPLKTPALLDFCGISTYPTGKARGALKFANNYPILPGKALGEFDVYASVQPADDTRVLATVDGTPTILERSVGRGRVVFLAGEFGIDLPANYGNQDRSRDVRVQPPALSQAHTAVLDALISYLHPQAPSLFAQSPDGKDVEVAAMRNASADFLLFAINWESQPLSCPVALPADCSTQADGFAIDTTGAVSQTAAHATPQDGGILAELSLEAQQAVVLRFPAR